MYEPPRYPDSLYQLLLPVRGSGSSIWFAGGSAGVSGAQGEKIRAGAAHDRLMIVVGDRVAACEGAKIRSVAAGHAVETHRDAALVGARLRVVAPNRALA